MERKDFLVVEVIELEWKEGKLRMTMMCFD